ncbi:MAG: type II toxin-antitoxin system RelE/ParE family toxin [Actinobacteria bacterium]|nr:type II toxin-antitoxin system RelE/ParE family toxin [Actinomycetota bacterium]
MEEYSIEISPAAERDLKDLSNNLKNFKDLVKTIDKLSINSRPHGVRKVKGFDNTFRIRFLSFRIIYDIYDKNKRIIILRIVKRDKSTYKFI